MKHWILFLFLSFIGCSVHKSTYEDAVNKMAKENFGSNCVVEYNKSKTYVLCYSSETTSRLSPGNALNFGIIDVKKQEVIYFEQKHHANVRWIGDYDIEVKARSEVQSVDREVNDRMSYYVIDVTTLQKSYKSK